MTLWRNLVVALVAAFALAACSSSDNGGGTDTGMMEPTPQETCENGGGRWNADMTCTSAEALAMERAEMQRGAIKTAIGRAETAVAGVDDASTDSEVNAANIAVTAARTAISGADDVPQAEKDANTGTVDAIANRLTAALESRTAAMTAADEQRMKDNAKLGKDLHAALGGTATAASTALDNLDLTTAPETDLSDGLSIDATAGAGALPNTGDGSNPDSEVLEAGDSVGALGSWMGTNYAHTDSGTKVVNEARVYTNQGAPTSQSFVEKYGDETGYVASTRTFTLGTVADAKVKSPDFPTAGTKTFTGAQDFAGTYDGADGDYKCAAASTCTAAFGDNGITLSAGWTFVHDSGARVSTPDANYLYYGWWLSKDKDGMPTAASAFTGVNGAIAALADDPVSAVTGSATYAGNAAGKFAMSNVLDGTGNGGHFTADVMLTAKFGTNDAPNNGGVSGTIDNFRLNDGSEDPGWSVALHLASWGTAGAFTSTAVTTDEIANGTMWSIMENSAPESGTWSGQMYDEKPGTAASTPPGDGSNVPTTVTGTFYSEFSTIGRMVGAFGADKQ